MMLEIWLYAMIVGVIIFFFSLSLNIQGWLSEKDSIEYEVAREMMVEGAIGAGILFLLPISLPVIIVVVVLRCCGYKIEVKCERN